MIYLRGQADQQVSWLASSHACADSGQHNHLYHTAQTHTNSTQPDYWFVQIQKHHALFESSSSHQIKSWQVIQSSFESNHDSDMLHYCWLVRSTNALQRNNTVTFKQQIVLAVLMAKKEPKLCRSFSYLELVLCVFSSCFSVVLLQL